MKASSLILVLLALLFAIAELHAQIPRTLSYQGVLTDTLGSPRPDGSYQFTFRLYESSTGGTLIWMEQKTLQVRRGLFYTTLGDLTTIPDAVRFDRPYWLSVQVASEPELSPRASLNSVGYSFSALRSDTAQFARTASADTIWRVSGGNIYRLSGNVGIGITNPTATFEVGGGGALKVSGLSQFEGEVPGAGTNWNLGTFGNPSGTIYGFSRFGAVHLAIDVNSGNIGIGNTSPSYKLDVNGPINATNFYKNGAPFSGLDLPFSGNSNNGGPGFQVINTATSGGTGVWGESNSSSGVGVYGYANASTGTNYGVYAVSNSTGGYGVYSYVGATSGTNYGMYGQSFSTTGYGLYGTAPFIGVYGSTSGTGSSIAAIRGEATATTGSANGVQGWSNSPSGYGVGGSSPNIGVLGQTGSTTGGVGVKGFAVQTTGSAYGIHGITNSNDGYAGFFNGRVHVAGTLSKSAGSFRIDHPLDPANKYLCHSFVESPDMMNIYNGNVTLDGSGEAWVTLPEWFEALNKDFRYQLTAVGAPGPNLHIAQKISGNKFRIAGGSAGIEVSWQVTGVRKDVYAEKHRIPVEEEKKGEERGRYMHPEDFGISQEMAIPPNKFQGSVKANE